MAGRSGSKSKRKDTLSRDLTETGERRYTYLCVVVILGCIWGLWGGFVLLLAVIGLITVWSIWKWLRPEYLYMSLLEHIGLGGHPAHQILKILYVKRWNSCAEAIGLKGSKAVSSKADDIGITIRLRLRKGQVANDVQSRLPQIESGLSVRKGSVRVLPESRSDRCRLRVTVHDKLANSIPWPGPQIKSIRDPIPIGLYEDQSQIKLDMLGGHILIGGMTDSGKSMLLSVILSNLAVCDDVVLWGIDLKGGIELTAWEDVFEELATAPMMATDLLSAVNRIQDARASWLADIRRQARLNGDTSSSVWQPTPSEPALVVVVDELAELNAEGHVLIDRLARMGRATRVQLVLATQRPSQEALGSISGRTQLGTRIALRVQESGDNNLILGPGRAAAGWRAERLGPPGSLLMLGPETQEPRPGRAYYIPEPQPPRQPAGHLDDLSAQAADSRVRNAPAHAPARKGSKKALS